MTETKGIHRLVARARRRLRVREAYDAAMVVATPAALFALLCVAGLRAGWIPAPFGLSALVICLLTPLVFAAATVRKRYPTHIVATRLDRSAGLSDRLASACDFERRIAREPDQDTAALMRAAIADAEAVLPRVDIKAATPFPRPRGLVPALVASTLFALVSALYFPKSDRPDPRLANPAKKTTEPDRVEFAEEDLEVQRETIRDMRRIAEETGDADLKKLADELEQIIEQAERGQLSKQEMLAKLAEAEKRYADSSNEDVEQAMAELEKTGRTLAQSKPMRELGEALQKNDLARAQKALEKLANDLENQKISEADKERMAEALDKAASEFERRKQAEKAESQREKLSREQELEKLEKELAKAKSEQEREKLSQELQRKKRELEQFKEEEQRKSESANRRHLERLHRDLRKASEEMEKDQGRQASQTMRDIQRSTGEIEQDQRKVANQKKVASQLSDLREAMRRAKKKQQGSGQRDLFNRNNKNKDFISRARGQSRSGRMGQQAGQGQQGQGQAGQMPGGSSYGEGHDPNLYGDPTKKTGDVTDVGVQGVQGNQGSSVKETILSAAQKGFAGQNYKQVFTRYEPMVEEVINSEKVPSGYKYYVKRYFQKIKPQE